MDKCDKCSEPFGFHLKWCGVESRMRKQPSRWSCLPTSFAMCLGVEPESILKYLGRDDSRGFHPMELTWYALKAHGVSFTPFDREPELEEVPCLFEGCHHGHIEKSFPHGTFEVECPRCKGTGHEDNRSFLMVPKMEELLACYEGVLVGEYKGAPHAVAWLDGKVYDPNYGTYDVKGFTVDTFWVMIK